MDALLEGLFSSEIDQQTVQDVLALFEHDRKMEMREVIRDRQAAGRENHAGVGSTMGIGQVCYQPTTHDYFAAGVLHNAQNDPDYWKWFAKQPDGEYSRTRFKPRTATIQNPWHGSGPRFRKSYTT